jgi:hypothetical protein
MSTNPIKNGNIPQSQTYIKKPIVGNMPPNKSLEPRNGSDKNNFGNMPPKFNKKPDDDK